MAKHSFEVLVGSYALPEWDVPNPWEVSEETLTFEQASDAGFEAGPMSVQSVKHDNGCECGWAQPCEA